MNGPSRLSVALVVALAVCLPTLSGLLDGTVPVAVAGLRFAVAFIATKVALSVVTQLMTAYVEDAERRASESPSRRATDQRSDGDTGRDRPASPSAA